MSSPTLILEIALPVPLRRVFDYLPPQDLPLTGRPKLLSGMRIQVPFGQRQLVGILLRIKSESAVPTEKLRMATRVLDHAPVLDGRQLKLLSWAACYYHHPLGEALHTALPTRLCKVGQQKTRTTTYWQLSLHGKGLPEKALRRSPRQSEALDFIRNHPGLSTKELCTEGISSSAILALHKKKLIEPAKQAPTVIKQLAQKVSAESVLSEEHLTLTSEQLPIINALENTTGFSCFLLEGVTGSGKTEVYLQAIEATLNENKQALVLIPEIGLTPQTLARFSCRFNRKVASYHSGLTDKQRLEIWNASSTHAVDIIIGTRSAIFLPLKAPGILIVDEEHDASFKQHDNFRYSARDLAIVRAQIEGVPVFLGSATPSLETLQNAIDGRYRHFRLKQRAGNASSPKIELIDTRTVSLNQGFSSRLLNSVKKQLDAGQQVLIFLNRRGYSPAMMCGSCQWIAKCPACDTRLTVHRNQNLLRCHHCDFRQKLFSTCPSCNNPKLDFIGQGTQRSEDFLKLQFPEYQTLRIDRDSIKKESDWNRLNQTIETGQPLILLGTQMLAKGHHYPDVTLVAIIDIDQGFFSADFRSSERTAQLITQVAGRSGRASKPGQVLLQTRFHDHPLIKTLTSEGYHSLALSLLKERHFLNLPPFSYQAVFRAEAKLTKHAEQWLNTIKQYLQKTSTNISLIGPLPSVAEKRAGYYRYELTLWSASRKHLQNSIDRCLSELEKHTAANKCRWHIDIDPYFS